MSGYFLAIYHGVTEISTREATGGLMVGLVLALVASGGCLLMRKRTSDRFPVLCGLILLVSVVSMAFGMGHSRFRTDRTGRALSASDRAAGFRISAPPIGRRLIDDADLDGDNRLTPDEAARFVKKADLAGKGWANASDIDRASRRWIVPRPIQDFHPDTMRRPFLREGF